MKFGKKYRLRDPEPGGDGSGEDFGNDFIPTDDAVVDSAAAAAALVKSTKSEKPLPKTLEGAEAELDGKDDKAAKSTTKPGETDLDPDDPDGELAAAAAAAKAKGKDTRIPLSRHTDILEKERAKRADLEAQLAKFQNGTQVAQANEAATEAEDKILKLEKAYAAHLTEGEVDKATATMREIRTLERKAAESKSDMKIAAAEARAVERTRYGAALERIEAAFPTLNEDHEDFDRDLLQEVVDLKGAYEARGHTPTAALQKAVKALVGVEGSKQTAATEVAPRVAAKDVAAERKAAAVTKNVDAATKQPPNLGKVGLDSDKAGGVITGEQVMKMSFEEFSKLDEKALAKLRGDEL